MTKGKDFLILHQAVASGIAIVLLMTELKINI